MGRSDREKFAAQVVSLQARLANKDPTNLMRIKKEAEDLISSIPQDADASLIGELTQIQFTADTMLQELPELFTTQPLYPLADPLQKYMADHHIFTKPEQRFLERIDPKKEYDVIARDENGALRYDHGKPVIDKKKVTGEEIRESLTNIKLESLGDKERDKIPKELQPAGDTSERMKKLKNSLDTLEAYKAAELHNEGRDDEIRKVSDIFDGARKQAKNVSDWYKKVESTSATNTDTMSPMEKSKALFEIQNTESALKNAENDLRKTLQEKVIDTAVLEGNNEPARSKAINMENIGTYSIPHRPSGFER